LEAWTERGAAALLSRIEPAPITSLSDRQNDIAEPLLCITHLAKDGWLRRLSVALQAVFKTACVEDASNGTTLLADIRAVFHGGTAGQIPSKTLAQHLCEIEGRPWADWSHGKGLSANNLARQLKKYSIYPQTIRIGSDTPKGYRRADFEDLWSRYCPPPPIQNATPPQPASSLAESSLSSRNTRPNVAVAKSVSTPHESSGVAAVAVQNRDRAASEVRI
jgi:hypothetical protein